MDANVSLLSFTGIVNVVAYDVAHLLQLQQQWSVEPGHQQLFAKVLAELPCGSQRLFLQVASCAREHALNKLIGCNSMQQAI